MSSDRQTDRQNKDILGSGRHTITFLFIKTQTLIINYYILYFPCIIQKYTIDNQID